MKAMVVGSGAREHAIVKALVADPEVDAVIAAPGNPGIELIADTRAVDVLDGDAVVALAQRVDADLVVIGPEAPLVAGVADQLRAAGFDTFGPSAQAAELEGSKSFAKDVMTAANVPTAGAHTCTALDAVESALDETGAPYVVKDDGLAAGKGVVVTDDRDEALVHAKACLAAGSKVVIEEFLDGPEVSLFCITDGETVIPLVPAQDFKRVAEGDQGPNTGGMGAYSPLEWAPEGLVDEVVRDVAQPTIDEMKKRGTPFAGVLYVGLALTSKGPKVVEFNARFGDPETQVVLARLQTPLGQLLRAAARRELASCESLKWSDDTAVTVVIASDGYPAKPRTGDPISGLEDVDGSEGSAYVLHAGTKLDDEGTVVSSGGRVLSVVGLGTDLENAREVAYAGVAKIDLPGSHFRNDIALKALNGEINVDAAPNA